MSFTNSFEATVLTYVQSALTSHFVALSTANPGEDGTGLAEPSGNGYSRVPLGSLNLSGSTLSNAADIEFPEAQGSWGLITHFAIVSASSGGTVRAYGSLASPKSITLGDVVRFVAGNLTITLD